MDRQRVFSSFMEKQVHLVKMCEILLKSVIIFLASLHLIKVKKNRQRNANNTTTTTPKTALIYSRIKVVEIETPRRNMEKKREFRNCHTLAIMWHVPLPQC